MSHEKRKLALDGARAIFRKKNVVAWIGKTQAGKTVASTLLYDTLHTSFLQRNKSNYTARVLKGHDEFEVLHKRMLKGYFPPATLPETKSELILEIASKRPLGKKIEILLRDASGEDLRDILQKKYDSKEELMQIVLDKHKNENEFGPLSYVIFANVYVILIDCAIFDEWRSEQIRLAQIINSILDIKRSISEVVKGKFTSPVAIIFTKFDMLNDNMLIQNKKKVTSEEIVAKYLPALESALEACHEGSLTYYQFSINGIMKATEEEAKEMLQRDAIELTERDSTAKEQARENAEKERQKTIESRVKNASNAERQNATNAGHPPATVEELAKKAGDEERQTAEEEIKISEDYITSYVKSDTEAKSTDNYYKIKLPLKYSEREYTKFILWLIERLPR